MGALAHTRADAVSLTPRRRPSTLVGFAKPASDAGFRVPEVGLEPTGN